MGYLWISAWDRIKAKNPGITDRGWDMISMAWQQSSKTSPGVAKIFRKPGSALWLLLTHMFVRLNATFMSYFPFFGHWFGEIGRFLPSVSIKRSLLRHVGHVGMAPDMTVNFPCFYYWNILIARDHNWDIYNIIYIYTYLYYCCIVPCTYHVIYCLDIVWLKYKKGVLRLWSFEVVLPFQ